MKANPSAKYFEAARRLAEKLGARAYDNFQKNPQRYIEMLAPFMGGPSKIINTTGTQTERTERMQVDRPKRRKAQSFQLGGKVSRIKKTRGDIFTKYCKRGFVGVRQCGVIRSDSVCCWVGHITHPTALMIEIMALSMVKAVARKMGLSMNDADEKFMTDTHSYRFHYYDSITGVKGVSNSLVVVANASFLVSSFALSALLKSFNSAGDVIFTSFEIIDSSFSALASIALSRTTFSVYSRSDLKIQNRTLVNPGDDEQDLDNQPLNGKLYEASGNQVILSKPKYGPGSASFLTADDSNGIFFYGGSTDTSGVMTEPQDKAFLVGCRKATKIRVNPGKLITSSLAATTSFDFNTFIRKYQSDLALVPKVGRLYGKYRMYALEKTLSAQSPITEGSISLATETQVKLGVVVNERKETFTPFKKVQVYL